MIYNASNIDLRHFDVVIASYDPKWIHAEAIQATEENIGRLSLEFEEELYNDGKGLWFGFDAERTKEDGTADMPQELYVPVGSWIVALRGELHVFPDHIFQNTFRIEKRDEFTPPNAQNQRLTTIEHRDVVPGVPRMTDEDVKKVGTQIEENFGQPTQVMTPVGGPGIEDGPETEIMGQVGELDTDEANGQTP